MPATAEALKLLRLSPKILTAGAKASGSGGVAVSALEMAQKLHTVQLGPGRGGQ